MYSPKTISAAANKIEANFPITLREYTPEEVDHWVERINSAIDRNSNKDNPRLTRGLEQDEMDFMTNERFMTKISYPYFATRYCWIKPDKGGEQKVRFWESQELLLNVISELEDAHKPVLIMLLKARQIGASTVAETILAHKCMTAFGTNSLIAADEPKQSAFLFNMLLRVLNRLPFWLRPHVEHKVKGTELFFDRLDSSIFVDSGNKRVGGVGQGKTFQNGHLSEMATWEDSKMVEEDLIPAVLSGMSPNMFFIMESTAKGYNHWRRWWIASKKDNFHGFVPVFIPWWSIKEKYAADPTGGWSPSSAITLVADNLKQVGVDLTRKQMYWWDRTYASYNETNRLNAFYAEYAGSDKEAFQLGGQSIFPISVIQELRQSALLKTRKMAAVYSIQNKGEIK